MKFRKLLNNELVIKKTKNYDVFKPLDYNRGKDDNTMKGIDQVRLNKVMAKIMSPSWLILFGAIYVNKDNYILDGHHRYLAMRKLGLPVYYIVITDEIANPKETNLRKYIKQLLILVSTINDNNSTWSPKDNFECARKGDFKLAKVMYKHMQEISAYAKVGIDEIVPNHLYSLIKKDLAYFNASKKVLVEEYDNKETFKLTKGDYFKDTLSFYKELSYQMERLDIDKLSRNKFLNKVFRAFWQLEGFVFDNDRFIDALKTNNRPIKFESGKIEDIKRTISDIYNYKFSDKRRKGLQIFKSIAA